MKLLSSFRLDLIFFLRNIDVKTVYVSFVFTLLYSIGGFYMYYDSESFFYYFSSIGLGIKMFYIFNFIIEFLLFSGLLYFCLLSKWFYKIIYLFIILVSFSFENGYQKFYSRFSDYNDIYVALTATNTQRLDTVISQINMIPTLFLFSMFLIAEIAFKKRTQSSGFKSFFVIIFLFFLHSITSFFIITARNFIKNETAENNININGLIAYPIPVAINTCVNTGVCYFFCFNYVFDSKRITFKYQSKVLPTTNIIVIVEETLRGDHLSINNYKRNTTPFLQKLEKEGLLQNYGICTSSSTASVTSNNLILTGLVSNTKNILKAVYVQPTVFQYAKAMNYKTYFFDPQKNEIWSGIVDDYRYIDFWQYKNKLAVHNDPDYNIDFQVAKDVNKIINTSTGNFIYIFKRGLHFPYIDNYPRKAQVWKPVANYKKIDISNPIQRSEELINTYDNSLKYNVDPFFRLLLQNSKTSLKNTVIFYTGDHGEMFLEDGKNFLHGKSDKREATVPLCIIGNNLKIDTTFRASHANILPTVLDYMRFPYSLRNKNNALSLLKAKGKDSRPRSYILPDLYSPKIIRFDK
jgi:glucan phosphoethanolaminetransferase (alkaline phosphatase superfamily)